MAEKASFSPSSWREAPTIFVGPMRYLSTLKNNRTQHQLSTMQRDIHNSHSRRSCVWQNGGSLELPKWLLFSVARRTKLPDVTLYTLDRATGKMIQHYLSAVAAGSRWCCPVTVYVPGAVQQLIFPCSALAGRMVGWLGPTSRCRLGHQSYPFCRAKPERERLYVAKTGGCSCSSARRVWVAKICSPSPSAKVHVLIRTELPLALNSCRQVCCSICRHIHSVRTVRGRGSS